MNNQKVCISIRIMFVTFALFLICQFGCSSKQEDTSLNLKTTKLATMHRGDNIVFSPNGRQVAYREATEGNWKHFIVLNGKEGKKYYDVKSPTFSPDSKQFAYIAEIQPDINFIVLNGKEKKNTTKLVL